MAAVFFQVALDMKQKGHVTDCGHDQNQEGNDENDQCEQSGDEQG
jgi:hypothetical protein